MRVERACPREESGWQERHRSEVRERAQMG
jgi:hypothetical protein